MREIPTIKDVMTASPHSIGVDQPIGKAKEMMLKHGFRHLPVQDGGRLVGVISERDVRFAETIAPTLNIEEIITPEPYIVEPGTKLDKVAEQMAKDKIGCALVAERGKLIGIYTSVDACRDLAKYLRA